MDKELYYFAHPYTVKDKNGNHLESAEKANFNLCNIRAAALLRKGYFIYSPISHSHPIHIIGPDFLANAESQLWINLDNLIIEKTKFKGIILAPGWETSKGCLNEKKIFEKKGLKILFYKDLINK